MEQLQIKKSIEILAPKERVWSILLEDRYTRQWYSEFSKGSHAETDWMLGSKAVFLDDTGFGLVARVIEHKPLETVSVEYEGIVGNGQEFYDTPEARQVRGGRETYHLSETRRGTLLEVASDMAEQYFEVMQLAWGRALSRIKNLAETQE